ncbi:MAG: hypothetical protein AVDCRST_MAG16-3314, partial [uncultured Frankineae bacterium]
ALDSGARTGRPEGAALDRCRGPGGVGVRPLGHRGVALLRRRPDHAQRPVPRPGRRRRGRRGLAGAAQQPPSADRGRGGGRRLAARPRAQRLRAPAGVRAVPGALRAAVVPGEGGRGRRGGRGHRDGAGGAGERAPRQVTV